ncbi:MAG: carbon storage regulator CsrA [bacterium]
MLVLTRRISEKFIVGNNVVITVLKVDGNQVRIGIEAPREISVVRSELVNTPPANLVK